ncbi:hypothetical protein ACFQJ5_18795 [Halomicroarcula sp. GCM10025324]|uniref:hypothetical protein n=1 Tax=Halomicroarcula sp. GCM10025324 TaxID=3252667 RepID=UPI00361E211A
MLITGNEADLDRIPLNDQLTADHAHQFGLAFHELLHILKTAISGIGDLIETSVESEYHEQVHDLINLIEDGAIESEAIHGDNFSDNAGIRLELTRRLHSQTPEDLLADKCLKYSFWDAVTGYLYDRAIFETGTIDCLLDPKDTRIEFLTEADRDAFLNVRKQLDEMVDSALKIWSASRDDTDHRHDKTASLRRARVVIDTWNNAIEPLLQVDDEPKQTSSEDGATALEVDNSAARELKQLTNHKMVIELQIRAETKGGCQIHRPKKPLVNRTRILRPTLHSTVKPRRRLDRISLSSR